MATLRNKVHQEIYKKDDIQIFICYNDLDNIFTLEINRKERNRTIKEEFVIDRQVVEVSLLYQPFCFSLGEVEAIKKFVEDWTSKEDNEV